MRGGQRRQADYLLRDHDRCRVRGFRPRPGRYRHPRGRAGRPARHHQRRRSRALRDHADRLRPHRFPGRQARRHRGRESRHPEARCAGCDRAPARGERRGDRRPSREARRPAVPHGPRMADGADRARASATKATCSRSTCRRPRSWAPISSTTPPRRSPASSGCARRSSRSTTRRSARAWPRWSGRRACRSSTRGPLVEALPPGCELWLDGGHNEDCGFALARMASDWAKEPRRCRSISCSAC